MSRPQPRQAMLDCAAADGDVAEGALWLAAEDNPELDPAPWLLRVDELAAELRTRCGIEGCSPSDAPLVGALLRDRLRLRGAGGGDPRAHYLHCVLERGAGVPIACSAIWIAVGSRASIPVEGVNMPGHFVVRVDGHLFDAVASGEPLGDEDVRGLVAASTGQEPERVEPAWLRRATTADILARMSRNLRRCYTSLGEWDLALQAADRCVLLAPDAPAERRDRGLLLARLGRVSAARTDISAYLEAAPEDCADRGALSSTLARLRAMLN